MKAARTANIVSMAPLGKKSGTRATVKTAVQDLFTEIPEQEKKLLRLLGNHLLAQFEEEIKNEKENERRD